MLVSHRYKFIYTKTRKTGGTSIESYFERFCMHEGEFKQRHLRNEYESDAGIIGYRGPSVPANCKWWGHMPAKKIKESLGEEIWNNYFKFCSIRNPFEKCISHYEFMRKSKKTSLIQNLLLLIKHPNYTYEQIQFINLIKQRIILDSEMYLIDGEFCLDDFIRYEKMNSEIERVCNILSIPFEPEYIPSFKSKNRRKIANIEYFYTQESIDLVRELFAYEFEKFGYKA
ncbi:MAG: sulfotransferase family protein [Melioribacteraceae bacterium]|nr:sulfotransferase family protein [Melioribacteraceae bacterium]MCF8263080.1 sulfotransferase family protein [Melioribacteraceae bacterium]MCF8431228.1 sulfotransferase family protein [Melioribacteraceae bacterium]